MTAEAPEILLSAAVPADTAALASLWVEAFEPTLRRMFGDNPAVLIRTWLDEDPRIYACTTLARIDGDAVGYIQLSGAARVSARTVWTLVRLLSGSFGLKSAAIRFLRVCVSELGHRYRNHEQYVYMLGVARSWRGRGVARRLLEYAENEARAASKTALRLGVVIDNLPALRLYERFGFHRGPCVRSRLFRWADGTPGYYVMTKPLD